MPSSVQETSAARSTEQPEKTLCTPARALLIADLADQQDLLIVNPWDFAQ